MADLLCRKVSEENCDKYDAWIAENNLSEDKRHATIFQKEDGFYYCEASMYEFNSPKNCEAIRFLNIFEAFKREEKGVRGYEGR